MRELRAPVASLGYTPHQAERAVLRQVVREHLEKCYQPFFSA